MAILAIDQGTSGTKVLLVGDSREILARGFAAISLRHIPGGGVECDAEEVWNSIVDATNQATQNGKLTCTSVAFANQGESILAWERKTAQPLSPIIVWQDSRSAQIAARRSDYSAQVLAKTGLAIDPYFVAPKMVWLRENLDPAGVITTLDSWIIARLTGAFVTDVATASRTLLLDINTLEWDTQLCAMWDISITDLPAVVKNDSIVGEIHHPDLPALVGLPLAGLIVDQPAALFAQGCFEPGQTKCTYGTGAFLLANVGASPRISTHGLATSVGWDVNSSRAYYLDGQVFAASSAVQWLLDTKLLASVEEIDSLAYSESGIFATPSFVGYGAPYWKAEAKAAISGLTLSSTRQEISRAVIDGIAAQVSDLIACMSGDGAQVTRLRVDGGLTQAKSLMQMQANLSQIPIDVFPYPDATALGVASIGALAMDKSLTIADTVKAWKVSESYEPQWSADRAGKYMDNWRTIVAASLELNHE
ncbi:MAG: carbohydrate kinase [Streptomycetaceae bacterium]|nr:MAG: carbohydrate kinase [Streptomycetaceae bacterium]